MERDRLLHHRADVLRPGRRLGHRTAHPNSEALHHLYNIHFTPDGKWIAATVHAGMGFNVDWSPDGRFLTFSRGPKSNGDLTKPGTHQSACEIVGVYAKDWNIYAVSSTPGRVIDMETADDSQAVAVTTDGASHKEPAWLPAAARDR